MGDYILKQRQALLDHMALALSHAQNYHTQQIIKKKPTGGRLNDEIMKSCGFSAHIVLKHQVLGVIFPEMVHTHMM